MAPDHPREGGCRCGRVRFAASAAPLVTMACHCRGCQRMTASAFSLSAAIPSEAFAVTAGEPVPGGLQRPEAQHLFCPHCKSWLFTRVPGMDAFVNVRATLFDEPGDWAVPFIETCTSEKLPWAVTPAEHAFEQFPPTDAWPVLLQAYAARTEHLAKPPPLAG